MSEPVIRSIPLSQLELSLANVRKTPAAQTAFDELKASIAAHGLLENLIVHCIGPGPDSVGRYAVIAGGRRLTALMDLARDGVLSIDFPVPCAHSDEADHRFRRQADHPVGSSRSPVGAKRRGGSIMPFSDRLGSMTSSSFASNLL